VAAEVVAAQVTKRLEINPKSKVREFSSDLGLWALDLGFLL
jgi:hypothetical protein